MDMTLIERELATVYPVMCVGNHIPVLTADDIAEMDYLSISAIPTIPGVCQMVCPNGETLTFLLMEETDTCSVCHNSFDVCSCTEADFDY